MHLVMLPPQALCNTQSSPFLLPKQFQSPLGAVEVVCGDLFEHVLWELHMAIFEFVIVVSCRVVNRVHKFIKLLALRLQEETGLLVAPSWVDVHWDSELRRSLRTWLNDYRM